MSFKYLSCKFSFFLANASNIELSLLLIQNEAMSLKRLKIDKTLMLCSVVFFL